MINSLHKLIHLLKEHVNQNNKEIQFNQDEINKLLSDISLSTRKKDLDAKYSFNRQLLNENSDFVKMQLELNEFLEKYNHLFSEYNQDNQVTKPENADSQSLFYKTVNGQLEFDQAHPQFNDPGFFKDLFDYFENHENYEMCEKLLKIRKR